MYICYTYQTKTWSKQLPSWHLSAVCCALLVFGVLRAETLKKWTAEWKTKI